MSKFFHSTLSRRSFLGASATVFAANALPSSALAQGAKFRRWEITDPAMPPRVLASYKTGISKMLNLPPTDPRNWYRNAIVHLLDCPHGNWWFLVWHRAYLGWLEVTLRDLSGDSEFALPYWDWTKTPRVPAAMFADVLDPNNGAFIQTFVNFKSQFEAAVTALYASFSQAQKDALGPPAVPVQHTSGFLERPAAGIFRPAERPRPDRNQPLPRCRYPGDRSDQRCPRRASDAGVRGKREFGRTGRIPERKGAEPQRWKQAGYSRKPAAQ